MSIFFFNSCFTSEDVHTYIIYTRILTDRLFRGSPFGSKGGGGGDPWPGSGVQSEANLVQLFIKGSKT